METKSRIKIKSLLQLFDVLAGRVKIIVDVLRQSEHFAAEIDIAFKAR